MTDTTLLTGGRIHSPSSPDATAMAVTDGTVVWVGQDGPGRALHPDAEEIELDGAFVAPAFVDAHVHATATGLHLSGVDLERVRDAGELLAAIADAARDVPPGGVLIAHGWDETTWMSPRLPSRADIDDAVGAVPTYLSRIDVHSALVSTALLDLAPDVTDVGGYTPDGPLTAAAHHHVRAMVRHNIAPEQRATAQRAFLDTAAAHGIVSVHECAGPDISGQADLAALIDLAEDPGLPDVVPYWGELATSEDSTDVVLRAKELGARGLAGDLFADGAIGSRTACLHEPYTDAGGIGERYLDAEQIAAHVIACTDAGLQAGFHVIGDAALSEIIAGFAEAERQRGRRAIVAGRHRLEHVEMIDEDQAAQLAAWNVTASVQPRFDALWGGENGMYVQRLGADRAELMNPFAMLAATGVLLAGGSDAPVTPIDPWASVRAAAAHRTPRHSLSARAAFNAHTRGGHRAAGVNDGVSGSLVPGAPAHYAVWDAGELHVAAADSRVQRWSTDPRSRVPPLPALGPDDPLPRCMRTVRAGVTIYESS
ncbi:amidohydrolase [Haloechinothrix salitolerans]|uniref:Amidohydrolase n=1 Tax=Haloechinothrix salitolerans TaxID=926830 RepID=A0ABW2C1K4_9PSEU